MKKLALIFALFCMAFAIHAQDAAPKAPRGPRPGQDGKRAPQENIVARIQKSASAVIELYDADKDGTLNEAEMATLAHDIEVAKKLQPYMRDIEIFQKLDTNHNMVLEIEETAKIRDVMKGMRRPEGGPNRNRPPRPQPKGDAPAPAPQDGEVPPAPPAAE